MASNSFFRGVSAFVATEIAVPLQVRTDVCLRVERCGDLTIHDTDSNMQDSIGDGGLYSFWGGLTLISELLIVLVWWKGGHWREEAITREARKTGQH